MLRRVGKAICFWYYNNTQQIRGEFTGNAGGANTLIKFKGLATVARTGVGTYTLTLLADDGVTARKGYNIKSFHIFAINPGAATGLEKGNYVITADALNASGTINFTTFQTSLAAADITVVAKVALEISTEAAT